MNFDYNKTTNRYYSENGHIICREDEKLQAVTIYQVGEFFVIRMVSLLIWTLIDQI